MYIYDMTRTNLSVKLDMHFIYLPTSEFITYQSCIQGMSLCPQMHRSKFKRVHQFGCTDPDFGYTKLKHKLASNWILKIVIKFGK